MIIAKMPMKIKIINLQGIIKRLWLFTHTLLRIQSKIQWDLISPVAISMCILDAILAIEYDPKKFLLSDGRLTSNP